MKAVLEARVRARLADLGSQGLLRHPLPPSGLDLCSNDYLGLATHPSVVQRLGDALAREGCGSTGSRLLRGHRESFSAIERRFAAFKRTERSLYLSSGYLANLAVLSTLPEAEDVVFSDAHNHASLIDGLRLSRARRVVFPHNDVDALTKLLAEDNGSGQRFVAVESLFSMDGDVAPLAEYAVACRRAGALLVVDEAHAVGVYGDDGSGLVRATGVAEDVLVSVNTAGKALGVAGAFVAGPAWAIDYLEQRARPFVFSTAAPPALAAALEAALDAVAAEPERRRRLHARVEFLRAKLDDIGIPLTPDATQIIPVVVGENEEAVRLAVALQNRGFDVRAIRPPSVPVGTARLRISVNAGLSESDLERFVGALQECLEEVAACSAGSS
jgi:8-amino-7-oxononanoate synthase